MEYLDILDKEGNVIGKKEKFDIYKDGDIHKTVHIWIINDQNELLLQKRSPDKETFANLWAISTAGHVKSGETSIEAAKRELKEELNLKVNNDDLKFLFNVERHQILNEYKINTFDDVYILHKNLDCEKTKLQKKELTDIMYIYYEHLEQLYKENNKNLVPATVEHTKLFKYLHKNLKPCYREYTFNYTKEDVSNLSNYNKIYNYRNIFLLMIDILLMIVGIFNYVWLLYFSIFMIPVYLMFIEYNANKKTETTLFVMDTTKTFSDTMKFHEKYFRSKNLKDIEIFYEGLKIVEYKNNIFIYLNPFYALILCKKDMKDEDIEFLKNRKGIIYKKK